MARPGSGRVGAGAGSDSNYSLSAGFAWSCELLPMMFIAGETQKVSTGTIKLIEDIIRDQLLNAATVTANRRGSRTFSKDDLVFQVRDKARVQRIRAFLAWKAIRKTARGAEDKDDPAEEADSDDDVAAGAGGAPAARNRAKPAAVPGVSFPWDISSFFADYVAHIAAEDPAEATSSAAALEKLRENDERTRDMTAAEYARWSEYRRASLTYRKVKRFREWCGLDAYDKKNKICDDVMDILGFLTSEMAQNLTAEALRQQRSEGYLPPGAVSGSEVAQQAQGELGTEPEGGRKAIEERHVRMALGRLQERPKIYTFFGSARPPGGSRPVSLW
ncbi:hypothetical protein KVR01_012114 [Diaporthe batatas]|uniref:uncharacterized protein n=1 Tax=Diaporthe batatas TaxID=748121 RepID=UPI001D051644|nr:uncharacterized protein KVR01_012114 [Diaporthe batatas]KAG8158353.1 hypothetical protein KVR01_012114 [Diaporthe batatas]